MSYPTGTVYKIICYLDSDIIYIGSTFNSLRNRWQEHKSDFRKYLDGKNSCISIYPYFEKYGIENFKIIKVKEYECYRQNRSDMRHLNVYEALWINKTKGCVNKVVPFYIQKLSNKQYREQNKEQIRKQRKTYREQNKDELKIQKKKFYDENRHKILQQKKQYQIENKEQIRERRKERYDKEKNAKQCKKYREQNKERIRQLGKEPKLCIICKSTVRKYDFKRHTLTQKHIQNAQQIIYNFMCR